MNSYDKYAEMNEDGNVNYTNAYDVVSDSSDISKAQDRHWDMSKSQDEYDALTRQLIDHTINPVDDDGVLHLAKVAWRALAGLERYLTNKQ